MRDLGEFVSVFKRALRDQFEYKRVELGKVLLITDLDAQGVETYTEKARLFLNPEFGRDTYEVIALTGGDWSNWADLRVHLDEIKPDLVITYRLLRAAHPELLTSLGVYVDTLTQVTPYPVLLLPNPHFDDALSSPEQLGTVVVATEHMYADHSLVNYGIRFTPVENKLFLCHVEDQDTFEYYMKAIEKVPELDNDLARERLAEQLTAMPRYYAESVAVKIEENGTRVKLNSVIEFGRIVSKYRELISKEPVSLLVFTTKDDTQLAMHSLGYSLAVEFRNLPVLLL